jgi:predicted nucleotidyltransferase
VTSGQAHLSARERAVLERVRRVVLDALGDHPASVYLFGSWARGEPRPPSDIDVAIEAAAPVPAGLLARVREALEDSTVPYRVEVVDLADADAAFVERVRREGVPWSVSGNA